MTAVGGSASATVAAVIVAGGAGARLGGPPKQFRPLGGRPMLAWSCARFAAHPAVGATVAVVPADVAADPPAWLDRPDLRLVAGGATRGASVHAGLSALAEAGEPAVLIHDAARPFVSATLVARIAHAAVDGPVVPVVPVTDTIKRIRSRSDEETDLVETTLERARLRAVQTPQGFPLPLIRRLHAEAAEAGIEFPDDAALCERASVDVRMVEGERHAWKITHAEDLERAEWLVTSGRVVWPGGAE